MGGHFCPSRDGCQSLRLCLPQIGYRGGCPEDDQGMSSKEPFFTLLSGPCFGAQRIIWERDLQLLGPGPSSAGQGIMRITQTSRIRPIQDQTHRRDKGNIPRYPAIGLASTGTSSHAATATELVPLITGMVCYLHHLLHTATTVTMFHLFDFPSWFQRESITAGNISICPGDLNKCRLLLLVPLLPLTLLQVAEGRQLKATPHPKV